MDGSQSLEIPTALWRSTEPEESDISEEESEEDEELNNLPELIEDSDDEDDEDSVIEDFLDPKLPCLGR